MKPSYRYIAASLAFLLILAVAATTTADGQSIKERIKARLPEIIKLKAKGILGENNQGYLEFVGAAKEKEDVVAAENKDRRTVYAAIAKKTGAPIENVGMRRAIQLADKAKPGEWIQDKAGKWKQK
ncbi:MAG: YdbL family protein [Desulfobacteraceae bacterium]|nr:YdbL family protein [Desulfobacteraceae bacterium]